MRLTAKFPANCNNSLEIPAFQGIWMLRASPTSRWRAASSIWLSCSTGSAVACCRGASRSRWTQRFASRRWKMPWLVTASRKSSIRTRVRSSRAAAPSPACLPTTALRSAWTAKGLGGTTFSFVERLWRTVKYEEVYLRAYDSVSQARASIGRHLDFYNARRPHSSLDGATPDQAYFKPLPPPAGQPNPGRGSTYRRGKIVQTNETSS